MPQSPWNSNRTILFGLVLIVVLLLLATAMQPYGVFRLDVKKPTTKKPVEDMTAEGGLVTSQPSEPPATEQQIATESVGESFYVYAGAQRVAEQRDGQTYYYHPDYLGTTTLITDSSGQKVYTAKHEPLGKRAYYTKSNGEARYTFTGKEQDETGLSYFGARYYDDETGRFLSTDPISDVGSPYAYVNNNPLRFVDPEGMQEHEVFESATIFVGDPDYPGESAKGSLSALNDLTTYRTTFIDIAQTVRKEYEELGVPDVNIIFVSPQSSIYRNYLKLRNYRVLDPDEFASEIVKSLGNPEELTSFVGHSASDFRYAASGWDEIYDFEFYITKNHRLELTTIRDPAYSKTESIADIYFTETSGKSVQFNEPSCEFYGCALMLPKAGRRGIYFDPFWQGVMKTRSEYPTYIDFWIGVQNSIRSGAVPTSEIYKEKK